MSRLKVLFGIALCLAAVTASVAQTTITSGTWADPTVWSPATVPTSTSTVSVVHPLTIDANITIAAGGAYSFNASSTDFSGGTNHTLTMTGGTLTIGNGSNSPTVTFGGAGTFTNSTVLVRTGATLILGTTTFNNGNVITVESGATLIVNGNLTNSNSGNGAVVTVGGLIYVNGNYITNNGSLVVDGAGDLITTGYVDNQGSSTVFGSNADCTTGPCSGQNLCTGTNTVTPASQFICSGASSVSTLDGNAMTNVNYQWQSSTTSATATDFADISGATSENYSPAVPSQTTWYRRVATRTNDATCVGRSVAVQITVIAGGSWSGSVSTDWHTAGNWCGGVVPTATTDVVINSTAQRQPTISTGTATVRNLTIGSGAVITINDQTLQIAGDLAYNGSLSFGGSVTGSVSFNGSTAQSITGSTPYIFNNVIFNNSAGFTFAGNAITINNALTMTAGNINLGGYNVTIGTSAASPGSLTHTSGRFYNGNITRWFGTGAVTVENVGGFFPIGSTTDNRPFYLGFTGLSAGGTVRVQHTSSLGSTAASFNDINTTVAIQRISNSYWTVSSANGLTLGANTYSATAGGTNFGTVSDAVNHLRLTQSSAAIGGNAGVNSASTTDLRIRRTGFTFPSNPFNAYIATSNGTLSSLPITLLNFSANATVEGVRLQWRTSMEENFSHFEIQRSRDGVRFEPIAQTPAKGGLNITTDYSFVDGSAKAGRFYFRLKSIDLDGTYEFSSVERVDVANTSLEIASIYPNPVAGRFTVSVFEGRTGKLVVLDKYGRNVAEGDLHEGNQDFEFQNLPSGIYYARIQTESGNQTIKVVISK